MFGFLLVYVGFFMGFLSGGFIIYDLLFPSSSLSNLAALILMLPCIALGFILSIFWTRLLWLFFGVKP